MQTNSPITILKGTLSVHSVTSTRPYPIQQGNNDQCFTVIGRGSCGTVFEIPGTTDAIKKGAHEDAIWNDFILTNRAFKKCTQHRLRLEQHFPGRYIPRVPRCFSHYRSDFESWWQKHGERFPPTDCAPASVFHMQRIPSVTGYTRNALVKEFFLDDEDTRKAVLADPKNKHCLVRLYLGANSPRGLVYDSSDTLRNFPLYLDQVKAIGLEVDQLAEEMAIGLAIVHWGAQIDGLDLEFVIGRARNDVSTIDTPDHQATGPPGFPDFSSRSTHLWMLDFDKCSSVDIRDPTEVLNKYFVAVTGNDPYFPNTHTDPQLWSVFRNAYLEASHVILSTHQDNLADALMRKWEGWDEMDAWSSSLDLLGRNAERSEDAVRNEKQDQSDQIDSDATVEMNEGD